MSRNELASTRHRFGIRDEARGFSDHADTLSKTGFAVFNPFEQRNCVSKRDPRPADSQKAQRFRTRPLSVDGKIMIGEAEAASPACLGTFPAEAG